MPAGPFQVGTIKQGTVAIDQNAQEILLQHRCVWEQKPILRRVYRDEFFARLVSCAKVQGLALEVGSGPGFFKQFAPEILATDLIWSPWLNAVVDAQELPFRNASVANIFGLDVLHHLADPMAFLREAERTLVIGGRLILVEPWVTPFSYVIYRYLHQEGCDLAGRPWDARRAGRLPKKMAFEGNQAIPYLLFAARQRSKTLNALPGFSLVTLTPFCLFAYLLSGGFKPFHLLPESWYPAIAKFERLTRPLWRQVAALRVLVVLEKVSEPEVPGKWRSA